MSNDQKLPSTEKGWLQTIVEASGASEEDVKSTLLKYGVQPQMTPPRAKGLRFRSIRLAGIRAESDRDGPFDRSWSSLDTGLWAVMSDRNLRGKSSILNLLYAAIRGEFPGRVKADVWKWLETVDVTYSIDNVLHRTELHKQAGEEDPARSAAVLSRTEGDNNWITLYKGDGGEGLKSQTERLMMEELSFPIIYAHNSKTGGHQHGWPLISSALFLSNSNEGKALFGDLTVDGIPLRLLQLFIGLPWVSTHSAALTTQKQLEESGTGQADKSGMSSVLAQRLEGVETKLAEARATVKTPDTRAAKRTKLAQLDQEAIEVRKEVSNATAAMEKADVSMKLVSENYDEARRRLKQLEDEQSAGYSFRKLSPTCCPACEAAFAKTAATLKPSDRNACALCKNELPPPAEDTAEDHIKLAKEEVGELDTSVKVARAKFKAIEKTAAEKSARLRNIQNQISALQGEIAVPPSDPELEVVQLEAQAAQLRDLIDSTAVATKEPLGTTNELKILRAATDASKKLMTAIQADVLTEIANSVMTLARKFGMPNVTAMDLDNGGRLKVHQGGADDYFSKLTTGERLRIKIAISLAAVEVAKRRGHGRHPGLLVIDSPASEEVVNADFEQMLDSVSSAAKDIGDVQIIIGTVARPAVTAVVPVGHRLHATGDDYLF